MRVQDAKDLVVSLMRADIDREGLFVDVDDKSPDPKDLGKLLIQARTARVIHRFSGWHVPIQLSWFASTDEQPRTHGSPFYWYVFAIPGYRKFGSPRYFICDYLQMKSWVLEFDAPLGLGHRERRAWRADLQPYSAAAGSDLGYFRWGDEPMGYQSRLSRIVKFNNIAQVDPVKGKSSRVAPVPESEAHKRLKLYVAQHPEVVGLSDAWTGSLEHYFVTGDHVDVIFRGPGAGLCVVEVELEGSENVSIGVHQAIKYRSLAASQAGIALASPSLSACVVAYKTDYRAVRELSAKYDVSVVPVREGILPPATGN